MNLTTEVRGELRAYATFVGNHDSDCACELHCQKCSCGLQLIRDAVPAILDQLEAAERFKAFVHAYLDLHGVPHGDPDNPHQKAGCRIGARLDLLFAQRDGAAKA
jgi:hypothetical protein